MKALSLIFLLFPFFCLAQESNVPAATKPSTTDCPTWNKKSKKSSKADYFQSLRTTKKPVSQASYNNSNSKIQPNPVPQRTNNSNPNRSIRQSTVETSTAEIPVKTKKERKSTVEVTAKSNTTATSKKEPDNNKKQKSTTTVKAEMPVVANSPSKEEKIATAPEKVNEPKTEEVKEKKEDRKLKRKLERMSRKTTKVRKHSNSKCPSF